MRIIRTGSILTFIAYLVMVAIGQEKQEQVPQPLIATAARDGKDKALYEKKGDKERIYKLSLETIWRAALKAAAEENVIDYSNEKEGIITYKTGISMASWGFRVSVTLSSLEDGRTRIKLTTQKTRGQLVAWGAGGRTAEKFFKGLDKQLAATKADR